MYITTVEEVRELQKLTSTGQAVVIKNAQNLTVEAQNAFLKTLEEAESTIVLLAENEDQLLPTVVSRCFVKNLAVEQAVKPSINIEDIKTREAALDYIDQLMLTRPYNMLRKLFQAKKYLKANTNVRLTLENLFIK